MNGVRGKWLELDGVVVIFMVMTYIVSSGVCVCQVTWCGTLMGVQLGLYFRSREMLSFFALALLGYRGVTIVDARAGYRDGTMGIWPVFVLQVAVLHFLSTGVLLVFY